MSLKETRNNVTPAAVNVALLACTLFLAVEPAFWLGRTWFDAPLASDGEWVFVVVAVLGAWSAMSRRGGSVSTLPALLFAATAAVRVAGKILAIDVLGALALVVDVYAIGLLLGLGRRERPLSPFWLAALFTLTLPLERIAQRLVGFGLQQLSAAGACGTLSMAFDGVVCRGTDILLNQQHVLVDLPCSGTRGLVVVACAFTALAALARPNLREATAGVVVTVVASLVSNTVRIVVLAVGIAWPDVVGVDVMAQPWHDIVGLVCLGLAMVPVVVWSRTVSERRGRRCTEDTGRRSTEGVGHSVARRSVAATPRWLPIPLVAACVAVLVAPERPVDVGAPMEPIVLPRVLAGTAAQPVPLSQREADYFTAFGGSAAKARYGDKTLLVVSTSAPLRHLHAPDECLRGAGYEVERLGIDHGVLPGALYRATDPDGRVWRVRVSYVSDDGRRANSISEAVWYWLSSPHATWTAVERISPWDAPPADDARFDLAVAHSLALHDDHQHQEAP